MTAWWRKNKNDDYSTPVEYLEIINKYVSIDKVICDPFYMNGSVKDEWKKLNRDILHNDTDFFESYYDCDVFISNPSYSNLLDVFRRFFQLGKPFSLLVPVQKICQLKIQKEIKDKDLQVIISPIYKGFINSKGEATRCPSQYMAWVCWKFKLDRDLVFV